MFFVKPGYTEINILNYYRNSKFSDPPDTQKSVQIIRITNIKS